MCSSRGHIQRYRILTGPDGELALNAEFAAFLTKPVCCDLMGAIAFISIMENCFRKDAGNPDCINEMLRRFQVLAVAGGQSHAETLHAFLQVQTDFSLWIARLKKKHGMQYGHDYIRIEVGNGPDWREYQRDIGRGDVIFGPRFAQKVAMAESTLRGEKVRRCIETYGGEGDNEPLQDPDGLFECLTSPVDNG